MKTLFHPTLHFAAVAASMLVNILLAMALDAALSSRHTLSVSQIQLPSVNVVVKRTSLMA